MNEDLKAIVERLFAASEDAREVTLDAVGEAIGTRAVSAEEIEEIIDALEQRGRRVLGQKTGKGVANLRAVLDATRALTAELGRRPTRVEITAKSGLSSEAVAHALSLAKIMQR